MWRYFFPVARVMPISAEIMVSIQPAAKNPEHLGKLKSKASSFNGEVMDLILEERRAR